MRNRFAILLALLSLFVAACGEKDEPEVTGPPVVTDPGGGQNGGEPQGGGGVALEEIGEFEDPVFVTQPKGDSALYVVEQTGQVVRVSPSGKKSTLLDISDEITAGGEQGLLSVAFAPDYARSGLFYVDYTNTNGDTRVVEYETENERQGRRALRRGRSSKSTSRTPTTTAACSSSTTTATCWSASATAAPAGDPERNGQDLATLLGKILRIDPEHSDKGKLQYSLVADNPYAGEGDARPEILAYGLRNPWRFSFDSKTGALWIGDVGQNSLEEIDVLEEPGAGRQLRLVRISRGPSASTRTRRPRTRSTPS